MTQHLRLGAGVGITPTEVKMFEFQERSGCMYGGRRLRLRVWRWRQLITSMALMVAAWGSSETTALGQITSQPITTTTITVAKAYSTFEFVVNDPTNAGWIVEAEDAFITPMGNPAAGRGSAVLKFSASYNPGRARAAIIRAGNHVVTVVQAGSITSGCGVTLSPATRTLPGGYSTTTFSVAPQGCTGWLASTSANWLSVLSGSSGVNAGTVKVAALANPFPHVRAAVVGVNNTFATVVQGPPSGSSCDVTKLSVAPSSLSLPATAASSVLGVTGLSGCQFVASSTADWVWLEPRGSAPAEMNVRATANTSPSKRTATLTVAGRRISVTQAAAAACSFSLSPATPQVPAAGGSIPVNVTASAASCAWNVARVSTGLSFDKASGTGSARILATIGASQTARTLTATIAGKSFSVSQAGPVCTYVVSPATWTAPAAGGELSVSLTAPAGCAFNVQAAGVAVSPISGAGSSTLRITVPDNNTGTSRTFVVSVGGRTITITQPATVCSYTVSPSTWNAPASGGRFTVTLSASVSSGCSFAVQAPGLSVTPMSGTGSATLTVDVSRNDTGASRTLVMSVAGRTVTVTQPPPCTYTVTPATLTAPAEGGVLTAGVTTSPATGCPFTTKASGASMTPASGTGSSALTLTVPADPFGLSRAFRLSVDNKGLVTVALVSAQAPAASFEFNEPMTPSIWRGGLWYHADGALVTHGAAAQLPVVLDADGDGRLDHTTFRNGEWSIRPSSMRCPAYMAQGAPGPDGWPTCRRVFGMPGDLPLRMRLGEGGAEDLAVYRPMNNRLYVLPDTAQCTALLPESERSSDGRPVCSVPVGMPGDQVLTGDLDADGKDDVMVFRPASGNWYYKTTSGRCPGDGSCVQQWGASGDVPLVARFWGGSAPAAIAVFRPSNGTWYLPSPTGTCPSAFENRGTDASRVTHCVRQFGSSTGVDLPVLNDWDGDGRTDIGVWRITEGNWYILPSSRRANWHFAYSSAMPDGWEVYVRQWGARGDAPISGAGTFGVKALPEATSFDVTDTMTPVVWQNGVWSHADGPTVALGAATQTPLAMDVDGDRQLDHVTFKDGEWTVRPSSGRCPAFLPTSTAGPDGWATCRRAFGRAGDVPLRMMLGEGGAEDLAVYRPSEGRLLVLSDTGQCTAMVPNTELTADGRAVCSVIVGMAGDRILTGDVDADGKDDVMAFRPSSGNWYYKTTTGRCPGDGSCVQQWGANGDVPLVAKFAGAGAPAGIAVFRPSNGTWYLPSTTGSCPAAFQNRGTDAARITHCVRQFGSNTGVDVPVLNDWDGDGRVDIGVWRSTVGYWYILPSSGRQTTHFNYSSAMEDGWPVYMRSWGPVGGVPISGAR